MITGACARRSSVALGLLLAVACTKPEPPVITPVRATVSDVSLTELRLKLQVEAYNPNDFELTARNVTGKVVVNGKIDLGSFSIPQAITLPKKAKTPIEVPVAVKWSDAVTLGQLAATMKPIPFAIDGKQSIGSERINVDVPFHIDGAVTHEELTRATLKSIPALPFPVPVLPH